MDAQIGCKISKNYEAVEIGARKPSKCKLIPRREACIWDRGRVKIWENMDQY